MQSNLSLQRYHSVDSLRGFALAGIFITHMLEQYIAAPRPDSVWQVENGILDNILMTISLILFSGKFFSIFSMLFGVSFAIMMQRAAAKGNNFSGRFTWRLILLLGFGVIHSLIYRGDILSVYALVGLLLPLFYLLPVRWLMFIAGALFLGLGRYLFFLITGKTTLLDYDLTPRDPVIQQYVGLLQNGTFIEITKENWLNGFASKYDFQFSTFGRGYVTLGYFLVGLSLVKIGFFQKLDHYFPLIKKASWVSLIIFVVCMSLAVANFITMEKPIEQQSWRFLIGITIYDIANICLTISYISLFLLWYIKRPTGVLNSLSPFGRMALTFYILQSVIGAFIFFGWGLGLLGKLHDWQTALLGIMILAVQIAFAKYWLSKFQFGPLEWIWRCMTYFKVFAIRKDNQ